MKILLVEDQLSTSLIVQAQLENWGYTVVCAQNGEEAWKLFQEDQYPIMLTDWLMPVMDGLEFCRAIRAGKFQGLKGMCADIKMEKDLKIQVRSALVPTFLPIAPAAGFYEILSFSLLNP